MRKQQNMADRLRAFRRRKGLTLREVALAIGVPASTYREWEYGRLIQGEPYSKLAETLGVSLPELLTGTPPLRSRVWSELEEVKTHLARLERELGLLS